MRRRSFVAALVFWAASTAGADNRQLPPGQTQQIQQQVEADALKRAEDVAARAKATTVGSVTIEAWQAIWRWNEAVRLWKKEKGAGAAPLLAEGVLFDCLGRMQGVMMHALSSEMPQPYFADLAAARPARAVKAFDAALKLDPTLVEARLRAARIRAPKDARALQELERLSDSGGPLVPYLAAINRAETARTQHDLVGAARWYERALALNPRSTAAAIALSALRPGAPVAFDMLDARDPYYTYPCTVLTAEVDAALAARVRKLIQ